MENIKLDNLYLGINDNKMNFLSLNFIPMTHNKRLDSSFFENPITSEITEVKHGEKYPELDGYVNGFFTISVHQLNALKKVHNFGDVYGDTQYERVSNPVMPKEIQNIRDWMRDDNPRNYDFPYSFLFRPIPSSFVEFFNKLKQADNDIKLDFYHAVRTSYLDDNVKIDMWQNEKNYFYNPIDNSINSVYKQNDRTKVEFDEDAILKSVMLPSIVSRLANNENILKRNMTEFYQNTMQNKTDELSYLSSFLPSKTITYLYFTLDNMNASNKNKSDITLPDFIKQTDELIKDKLTLVKQNPNEDDIKESKKQLLSNPIKFTNEMIDNSFIGQQLLPEINKFLEAKIGKHGVKNDIDQLDRLEKENVRHHLHNFIMHRATELFNINLLNYRLDNGSNLEQEKQNIPTQLITPSGNRWHEQLVKKIYFDEMDKDGIEYMHSVVESKEKLDKSLDDNLKTNRKQRI